MLNAFPYAFLDDAPLEERRARAVSMRGMVPDKMLGEAGRLDPAAIDELREDLDLTSDAVDKAGYLDRDRLGIGGHSYGAFSTMNAMTHTPYFKAGIAGDGMYNRTLTPFGFQSERRTLWEASEVYSKLSPFQFAHKITRPLLLIHGAADNNPGTFPMQSERMYQAVRGNGGTVRLVLLPHEAHGYAARESIEHTLAEMLDWFDKYVK